MLDGREWFRLEGASAQAIEVLRASWPIPLPNSLIALLSFSNGGEGPLPVQPLNFCFYSAEKIARAALEGAYDEHFDGLVVFGSNGGGEALALDTRQGPPFPIVYFDMTNIDDESIQPLAADFDAFLGMVGTEG